MRYFCLTSIDVEEHLPPNNPWDTIFNISHDPDEMEKRILRFKEYVFTEIQIGLLPGTKTYMLVIHRHTEPDPYYYIAMKPGVLAVLESKNDFIDITINISTEEDQRNFFRENVKPTKIRIRNIKNTIVKRIRNEDHKNYQAYLKTIKNYCAENPERSIEDAFDEIEMPASLISGVDKSLTNKFGEIRKAISDLCGSIVNIRDIARYNKPLDTIFFGCTDTNIYIKNKEEYNDKIRDNKLKWAYLNFESIAFSEFDKSWFDAVNIFGLELRNVTISNESQNLWQNFAEGIQNMEKLTVFTLSANLKKIPSIVFRNLPISITHLDFSDNNLTSIPSKINRLINLQSLNLTNNKMLTENGIPWKSLPTTLKSLYLNNTGITTIPESIAHLTTLLDLNLKDTKLEKVAWTCLNKNLKSLEIEFAENFNGIIELPDLESLEMRNILYLSINYEKLPVTLTFLDLYNCKIDSFQFISNLLNLKSLHLSKNKMTSIPWKYFPESLRILNISHNNIKHICSMKFWKKLTKFDVSYNKVKMFEYYFDEDAYDEIDPLTDYKKSMFTFKNRFLESFVSAFLEGIFVNLYHNELKSLPYGFENFTPLSGLNIGHNKFNTANLNDALWKRLPSNGLLKYLCLNENKLNSLPCLLKNFPLEEIETVDSKTAIFRMQLDRAEVFEEQDQEKGHFDCALEIGKKKLYCHKFVLACASETFNALLSDRWNGSKDGVVKIENPDYTYECFNEFLTYLYSGDCNITQENVFVLTDMAEYYGIELLKDCCDAYILKMDITLENIEELVEFGIKYSLMKSMSIYGKFVNMKFQELIKAADFVERKKSFMEYLSEAIDREKEPAFYNAVCIWAEHQASIKKAESKDENFDVDECIADHMDGILPNIEFTVMHLDFIKKFVLTRQYLFSSSELYEIIAKCGRSCTQEDELFFLLYQVAEKEVKQKTMMDDNFNFNKDVVAELIDVLPHIEFHFMSYKFLIEFVVEKEFTFPLVKVYRYMGSNYNTGLREQERFTQIYEIMKKQVTIKQSQSPNDNFDLNTAIKNELTEVIPTMKFHKMTTKFLMEVVVVNGIISEDEAKHVSDICLEIKNDNKTLIGIFKDNFGIYDILKKRMYLCIKVDFDSPAVLNGPRAWNKFRLTSQTSFKIPETPSTVSKMKGAEWYLCLYKDGTLTAKHFTLIDRNDDYLITEMRSKDNEEFRFNTEAPANVSVYHKNVR